MISDAEDIPVKKVRPLSSWAHPMGRAGNRKERQALNSKHGPRGRSTVRQVQEAQGKDMSGRWDLVQSRQMCGREAAQDANTL